MFAEQYSGAVTVADEPESSGNSSARALPLYCGMPVLRPAALTEE